MKVATIDAEERRMTLERTRKPMMWIGIVSIVMLFAGLTSAYLVAQAGENWFEFPMPDAFLYVSTPLILISSITMFLSTYAVKKNQYGLVTLGLVLTLVLGIGFVIAQYEGWKELVALNVYFVDKNSTSGSFFYLLTGAHIAHLAGGIIALMVSLVKSILKKYNSDNFLGLQLTAMYWHFLDILWVYLLLFLYFIR